MRRPLFFFLLLVAVAAGTLYYFYFYLERQPVERQSLQLYGNVDVRQVDIAFRVSGRVEKMAFEEGDLVAQGAYLGEVSKQPYLDQLAQALASINAARASLHQAELLLVRRKELSVNGSVSKEDYENALSSKQIWQANVQQAQAAAGVASTNFLETEVYAPSAGTILTRVREPGAVVREGDPIYTLSILSPVWVRAFVLETDLPLVYPGMPAQVFTDTAHIGPYEGHIGFISPVAEFTPKSVETTQLRTDLVYRLRIIVDNPDRSLRQGMPVTVHLPLAK